MDDWKLIFLLGRLGLFSGAFASFREGKSILSTFLTSALDIFETI